MADAEIGDKIRCRFRKEGDLRLLSHHDLMRCVERMLRRARLPFRLTQGYHPCPRIIFAQALPLGVAGLAEVLEIEFTQPLPLSETLEALNREAPSGLVFTTAKIIPLNVNAVPRRAVYEFPIPPDRNTEISERCQHLLAAATIWIDKQHPRPRRVNVRPYLRSLEIDQQRLRVDTWITGHGSIRIEEFLAQFGLDDELARGSVLTRTWLELHDEVPPTEAMDAPPNGPPETVPLESIPPSPTDEGGDDRPPWRGAWGLSPNGPVVE